MTVLDVLLTEPAHRHFLVYSEAVLAVVGVAVMVVLLLVRELVLLKRDRQGEKKHEQATA